VPAAYPEPERHEEKIENFEKREEEKRKVQKCKIEEKND
jgi:hypothetical protein